MYPLDAHSRRMLRKDSGLRIRVEADVRQEFVHACREEGKAAAQVLREFMRDYIVKNRELHQRDMFADHLEIVDRRAQSTLPDNASAIAAPASEKSRSES